MYSIEFLNFIHNPINKCERCNAKMGKNAKYIVFDVYGDSFHQVHEFCCGSVCMKKFGKNFIKHYENNYTKFDIIIVSKKKGMRNEKLTIDEFKLKYLS